MKLIKTIKTLKPEGYTNKLVIDLTLKQFKEFNKTFKRGEKIMVELLKYKKPKLIGVGCVV